VKTAVLIILGTATSVSATAVAAPSAETAKCCCTIPTLSIPTTVPGRYVGAVTVRHTLGMANDGNVPAPTQIKP
jgi:hypothetical protein